MSVDAFLFFNMFFTKLDKTAQCQSTETAVTSVHRIFLSAECCNPKHFSQNRLCTSTLGTSVSYFLGTVEIQQKQRKQYLIFTLHFSF